MPFDRSLPPVRQTGDWQCSAASSAWVLQSLGIPMSQDDVVSWLGPNINQSSGLQEASGRMLAELFKAQGLNAEFGTLSWEQALEMAGRQPFCLGGAAWNHWTAVRDTDGDKLLLANPAPNWKGVGDDMDRGEWNTWGGWRAAWVNLATTLADLEQGNGNIRAQLAGWQGARSQNGEDPNDWAAFRQHLIDIAAPDPGPVEPTDFRR